MLPSSIHGQGGRCNSYLLACPWTSPNAREPLVAHLPANMGASKWYEMSLMLGSLRATATPAREGHSVTLSVFFSSIHVQCTRCNSYLFARTWNQAMGGHARMNTPAGSQYSTHIHSIHAHQHGIEPDGVTPQTNIPWSPSSSHLALSHEASSEGIH